MGFNEANRLSKLFITIVRQQIKWNTAPIIKSGTYIADNNKYVEKNYRQIDRFRSGESKIEWNKKVKYKQEIRKKNCNKEIN